MAKKDEARTFLISVAAELAGMHAQTLRTYDRLGLVSPDRTSGGGRRYSEHDVDLLREVQRLSQDEGVNLAGIKRIIELTNQVEALQSRLKEMAAEVEALRANQRRDIAVVPKSTAVVVWQPRRDASYADSQTLYARTARDVRAIRPRNCDRTGRADSRRGATRRWWRPSARSTRRTHPAVRRFAPPDSPLRNAPRYGGRRR